MLDSFFTVSEGAELCKIVIVKVFPLTGLR